MTKHMTDDEFNAVVAEASASLDRTRALIAAIDQARDSQPERLSAARLLAAHAREETLADEPWSEMWTAHPMTDMAGELTGMMALPNIDGKELWGTRVAFDFLDAAGDQELVEATLDRYFSALDGNIEHLFFIFSSALCTIAEHVMPAILDKLEHQASDYDSRVLFADAARNAWATRLNDPRGPLADPDGEPA